MKVHSYNEEIEALEVDPQCLDKGISYAEKKNYTAIRISALNNNDGETYDLDLSPFTGQDFITSLIIDDNFKIRDLNFSALYSMKNLKELSFSDRKFKLDFTLLPHLETLYITYNDGMLNLGSLKYLKDLLIVSLSLTDCSILNGLNRLKDLRIIGSFTSLTGITSAAELESLNISYSPKLTDITEINQLKSLQSLHIEKCKALTDFSFLGGNETISDLFISELDSLSFVPGMKALKELNFWDLKDGDLNPVLASESLKEVYFHPSKKHYTHTVKQINQLLPQRI
ncbi:internalin A [Pedobacter cryoconitis]|uniref:Internalin A n=1 Tax=Pedobacter cryoconitis TaxID=188932 RepID=A0A7W9E136_9SPHI|nr:toxin [Pedobacter cryoconitis]MBB5637255.1 internalin A [Pedobacter cryoconitis]MBB6274015.1 internalin A [Pedobacter cryoconitis]